MNIMRSILAVMLIVCMSGLYSATKVTVYGDENYPPYSYKEGRQMKGIYPEILKKIFGRMKDYDVELKGIAWKRGLKNIAEGTSFALFPPYYHPTKRPYINPYSEPILDEEVVVFVRKNIMNKPRKKWPEDFYGLKAGENAGFRVAGDAFYNAVQRGDITREEAKDASSNLKKLAKGRIDCYINDKLATLVVLKDLKDKGQIKSNDQKIMIGPKVKVEAGYLGYSKFFKATWKADFIKKFDMELKKMKASGEIDKILRSYR